MDDTMEPKRPRRNHKIETPPGLIHARDGAKLLDISPQTIYYAVENGTLKQATGPGVPEGIWFEEEEFRRWDKQREILKRQGRRPNAETKMGGRLAEYAAT